MSRLMSVRLALWLALVGFMFFVSGCATNADDGFDIRSDGVYRYQYQDNYGPEFSSLARRREEWKIEGADPKTFVILNSRYGRDKSHVYDQAQILKEADPATTVAVDGYIIHDDKRAFGAWAEFVKICDVHSFHHLVSPGGAGQPWYADDHCIYYRDTALEIVPDADALSFVLLSAVYGKDKNHVYFEGKILKGADAPSFVLDHCGDSVGGRDKGQRYCGGQAVPANPSSGHGD